MRIMPSIRTMSMTSGDECREHLAWTVCRVHSNLAAARVHLHMLPPQRVGGSRLGREILTR